MILCMTTDDMGIVTNAYSGYDQRVFGIPYCYLPAHDYTWLLGEGESLFISAHGNDTEIGNAAGQPAYTPAQLRDVLMRYVLPNGYQGRIYISACHSAHAYIDGLRAALGQSYAGRVFGMFGDIEYQIAPPSSRGWIAAR